MLRAKESNCNFLLSNGWVMIDILFLPVKHAELANHFWDQLEHYQMDIMFMLASTERLVS